MRPAIVKYIGRDTDQFSHGKTYEAVFVEYWKGIRHRLHVRPDYGRITDDVTLEDC